MEWYESCALLNRRESYQCFWLTRRVLDSDSNLAGDSLSEYLSRMLSLVMSPLARAFKAVRATSATQRSCSLVTLNFSASSSSLASCAHMDFMIPRYGL